MKRTRITITGLVQGVWYRKSALEKAKSLGLTGWVKNLSSGAVLAEAEGKMADVEQFITWCYQGPENAVVTGVETENVPMENDHDFLIRH
jgi:acylphosphatase